MKTPQSAYIAAMVLMFASAVSVSAQSNNLIASSLNGQMTAAQINRRAKMAFGDSVTTADKIVELYKITYRSLNDKNAPVIVSGLVALPKNDAPKGLVVFNHGTTADRQRSPSLYNGEANASETELAILAFASGGYAVAMPDYLGLGDEKGFHPYPLGAVNSVSAIDIIIPARALARQKNVALDAKLFVTGYSEGGGVAMWTARDLERKSSVAQYRLTASAPLSGPYDLSGTTRKWLLAPTKEAEPFLTRLYLLSFMAQYFHKNRGAKLTDYFKPAMALTVAQAYKTNRKDEDIIKRLGVAAVLMRAGNSLENVITPRFKKALEQFDRSDSVINELQKNDAYDWTPRTPMLLVNLEGDAIVDAGSTEKAFETMKNRSNLVRQYVIKDASLNHITAAAPAILQARLFFDQMAAK